MDIGEIFYPKARKDWRNWLAKHHQIKQEVWLQRYLNSTDKASISYDDLVEECLCFGWIDGIVKKLDADSNVRRITPRRKKSFLSELNRQRIWKLQHLGLMTEAGLAPIKDQLGSPEARLEPPAWLQEALMADPKIWETFQAFPHLYQRLKLAWISEVQGKSRQAEAQKRLDYLLKMTAQGKRYGTEPLVGIAYDL
jgi:uncharacterized protein YdeI (YjbR/CyaY-like superfamily)